MVKLLRHLRKNDVVMLLISIVFIVCQVWLDLKLPDYMSELTVLIKTEGGINDVLTIGGKMLFCAFGSLAASILVGFFAARIAAALSMNVRSLIYGKVQSFSMEEINKFSTPSLITRSTNDITQIQTTIAMGLQAIIKAPIMAVWAMSKIANTSIEWTTATGAAVVFLLLAITVVMVVVLPRFKKIQKLTDQLNGVTRENLTGLRVVRAYNAEEYQQDKFDKVNEDLTDTNLLTNRFLTVIQPIMTLINSGLTLSIYWIGAYLIENAGMEAKLGIFSDMVVFMAYAMQVVIAFMLLAIIFIMMPRAAVSANRINEVLETHGTINDGTVTESPLALKGEVEFKNVSFKYPDAEEYVIHNVSFKAKRGETVAFIGSTGSGKSTLINLIPRFYDATDGEVLVSGVNVKDYNKDDLYNKLGYVPQRAVLFSGNVSSNVAYGDNGKEPASLQQIQNAVEVAQGRDFVENMDGGYEAAVSQGGTNLSGGQKQRLAIARAVCREPEVYIFDDSFSALDYKTDKELRRVLKEKTGKITNLIVAQRIGTIIDADKIVVLDEGEVVGSGTHRQLLSSCPVYREIAESQLSKEELDNA